MPVYGLIPLMNMKEIRAKALELDLKMKEIGAMLKDPFKYPDHIVYQVCHF
jgi:adenine deaminase